MIMKHQSNVTQVDIWYLEDKASDVKKFKRVVPILEDRLEAQISEIYLRAALPKKLPPRTVKVMVHPFDSVEAFDQAVQNLTNCRTDAIPEPNLILLDRMVPRKHH